MGSLKDALVNAGYVENDELSQEAQTALPKPDLTLEECEEGIRFLTRRKEAYGGLMMMYEMTKQLGQQVPKDVLRDLENMHVMLDGKETTLKAAIEDAVEHAPANIRPIIDAQSREVLIFNMIRSLFMETELRLKLVQAVKQQKLAK